MLLFRSIFCLFNIFWKHIFYRIFFWLFYVILYNFIHIFKRTVKMPLSYVTIKQLCLKFSNLLAFYGLYYTYNFESQDRCLFYYPNLLEKNASIRGIWLEGSALVIRGRDLILMRVGLYWPNIGQTFPGTMSWCGS